MDDDSMIKVMQTLDLNYNPAINSTLKFQKKVADLQTQLMASKASAMQSAKDINNAFSSQLGQMAGNKTIVDQYGNSLATVGNMSESARQKTEKLTAAQRAQSQAIQDVIRQYKAGIIDAQKFVQVASGYKINQGQWGSLPAKSQQDQVSLYSTLTKAEREYQRILAERSNVLNASNNSITQSTLASMKAQAASIQQRVSTKGLSEEYSRQAGMLREQLSLIQARLQAEGRLSIEEANQTNQLREQLNVLQAQTRTAISDNTRTNPSTIGDEFQRRSSWFLTGAIFYGTIRAAKKTVEAIKDVEMGMTEIARVMEDSNFVFNDYRDNLLQLGVDYGQTFDNVQSISLRWAQSGYNVADSLKLTETSLLALNTAELDSTNATESMIGIMAQWQLQAEDLALVMDKVNLTADNYSVTSQDLVDGLLRSSSAAKNMNMTLDQTIGLLTVMREASGRTGAEVGNALNSILSYIQRPGSINTLESMGIQMFTDASKSQFRNALEIFKDISTNWGSLSAEIQDGFVKSADDAGLFSEELATAIGMQEQWNDVQQRDVSQASAGVYRRNYFIGMIERMSNVQGILNGMMDAEGYSMRENTRTMDTLEKKNQSLKASMEALAVAMGDAGLGGSLKVIANGGTGAINMFNQLPKSAKDAIGAFASTFLAVKTLQLGMKTFGIQLAITRVMSTAFNQSIANSVTTLSTAPPAIAAVNAGVSALQASIGGMIAGLKAFAVANAPLLVISASIGLIMALKNAEKKRIEVQEKAIEVSKENIKSLGEERQGLSELAKEYSTLKDKEKSLTATADEKIRLRDIQRELVDLYGVSITGIDAEGKAYADSTNAIQARIKALEEMKAVEEESLENAVRARDIQDVSDLEKNLDKRVELAKQIKDKEREIEEYLNVISNKGTMTVSSQYGSGTIDASTENGQKMLRDYIGNLSSDTASLQTALTNVNAAISEGTQNRQQLLQADATKIVQQLTENGVVISDSARAYATELAKGLSQAPKNIFELREDLEKAIKEFASSDFEQWSESYKKAISEGDTKGIDEASNAINGLVQEFIQGKPHLENWGLAVEGIYPNSKALQDASKSTIDLKTTLGSMGTAAKKAFDDLKTLNQAIYDVKNGQVLSADTIMDLIEKYGLSTDAIKQTTKGYTVEVSALEDLRKAKIKTALDGIEAEKRQAEAVRDQVLSRLKNYGLEIEQLKNLAEVRAALAQQSHREGLKGLAYDDAPNAYDDAYSSYFNNAMDDVKVAQGILGKIEEIEKRSKLLSGMLNDKNYGVSESKTNKDENKPLEEALKLLEHRKKMSVENLESIKAEIAELNRINNLYVKTADERMSMAERIYSTEKRYMDRRLQDSINWINEKKNLNELSVEEEIVGWERVKNNQSNNIEAVKQATLNLYKLRNQVMTESFNKEESTINHLTKIGLLSVQQQIDANKKLYESKATSLEDERKRVENLFGLYKSLLGEQKKTIKDAYDERIKLIDEEAKKKKDAQDVVIKGIEKELELLNIKENESNHEKKMDKLYEDLEYWKVRTSEEARKKVIEIEEQIDEENHKREIELERQSLEDKKKIAQDGVTAIEDAAKEEREKWEMSYKLTEKAFDDHSTNIVALAATMSKEAYLEWEKNYLTPLQNALASGDFDGFNSIAGGLEGSISGLESNVTNSNNAQVYRLANDILELKRQYEVGGDKSAQGKAVSIYDELARLKPGVADNLHRMDYMQAQEYVKNLPKMHGGGKSLSYGAVEMMPGELTFPPDLSIKLEGLIGALYQRPTIQSPTSNMTDRRVIQNFNAPLFNSEKTVFEDDTDERSFARELQRQISGMA